MSKMRRISTLLTCLAELSGVLAHGYVGGIAIDGKWYAGNQPNNYQGPSPIRLISDIGPVKGASNPDLICGLSAQKAELVVPASPGSLFSVQWTGGDGIQNWPHNTGPLMTYMTSCGKTTCDQFDPTNAEWFKIDQLGRKSDGSTWYQADILNNNDAYEVNLPQNLAPGGYLIRHEIIALHLAVSMGGAEFYPMCTQVIVGGNGNGSPSPTVKFPGAYSDSDPGIYDPSIFDAGSNYTFPGGPISNLAGADQQMVDGVKTFPPFPSGTDVGSPSPVISATGTSPSTTGSGSGSGSGSDSDSGSGSGGTGPTPSVSVPGSLPSGTAVTAAAVCSLKKPTDLNPQKRHFRSFLRRMVPYISH